MSSRTVIRVNSSDHFDTPALVYYMGLANGWLGGYTTPESAPSVIERTAGTIRNLSIDCNSNATTGATSYRLRKNAADGNLQISIPTATTGEFQDTSNSDSISPGDSVNLRLTTAASGNIFCRKAVSVHYPSGSPLRYREHTAFTRAANSNFFYALMAYSSATEATAATNFNGAAGTWKNLLCRVYNNTVSASSTFKTRKNSADGNQTVTIPSNTTGDFEDTTHTDSLTSGDDICYQIVAGATGTSIQFEHQSDIEVTAGHSWLVSSNTLSRNTNVTNYMPPAGGLEVAETSDAWVRALAPVACIASKLQGRTFNNSANQTVTLRFRKNGANGNQVCTIAASTSGYFEDASNTDSLAAGDTFNYQVSAPSGTGSYICLTKTVLLYAGLQADQELTETVTLVDTMTRVWTAFKTLTETVTLVDTVLKQASRVLSEVVTLVDSIIKQGTKVLTDVITLSDGGTVLDQQNTSGAIGVGFGDTGNGRDYMVMGFIPTKSNISSIDFHLHSTGSKGMRVWIDEADASFFPVNGVGGIGGSREIPNAELAASLKNYPLGSVVPLTPGNRYVIGFAPWNTSTHAWDADYRDIRTSVSNPYANGRRVHLNGSYASPSAPDSGNADLVFATYSDAPGLLKSTSRTLTDVVTLVATYVSVATLYRTLTETVTLVDSVLKQGSRVFSEVVTLVDTVLKQAGRTLSEAVVLVDTIIRNPIKVLSETITLVDTMVRDAQRTLSEVVTLVDTFLGTKVAVAIFTEAVALVDTVVKMTSRTFTEVATLVDSVLKQGTRTLSEVVTLVDTVLKQAARTFTEAVTIVDTVLKSTARTLSDPVALVDTVIKGANRTISEVLTLTDTLTRQMAKTLTEAITLVDSVLKTSARTFTEAVTVVDTFIRSTARTLAESVAISDIFAYVTSFGRTFTETVTLTDTLVRSLLTKMRKGVTTLLTTAAKTATILKTATRTVLKTIKKDKTVL